ncbi:hypothetical protein ABZ930_30265 [Streptomyces sp. NPDC046716]|uniref:hypothetical protein n=1 Tax=Streptomyces sp. NPDC046716 TaxID=3157093 RepID=UPI003402FB56
MCAEPGDCVPFVSCAVGALSEDVLMCCALSPDGEGVGEAVDVSAAARVSGPECGSGDLVPASPPSRCGDEPPSAVPEDAGEPDDGPGCPDDPSAPLVPVCTEVSAAGCCSR